MLQVVFQKFLPPQVLLAVPPMSRCWAAAWQGCHHKAHFGLQGQTARKGTLAYCQKPKGMSDGHYFLAIYVWLSRAIKLDDLLLIGLPARRLFEKGLRAWHLLQQRMKALEDRAAQDHAAAEGIKKPLDWPKPQHFDDAFAAAANHEP